MVDYQRKFLDKIKNECINAWNKNKILPSFLAVQAILITHWGRDNINLPFTNNLYNLPADDKWYGECYSLDTQNKYKTKSECKEIGARLIKVYNNYSESIIDFVNYLISVRRSDNGPYKYSNIIGCKNYKDLLDRLQRDGYMRDYLHLDDDIIYISNMIKVIEENELNMLDLIKEEQSVSNKKYRRIIQSNYSNTKEKDINQEEKQEKIYNSEEKVLLSQDTDEIYRVRLDWDDMESQIYASQDLDKAVEVASQHPGYKVYNSNGDVVVDPDNEKVKIAKPVNIIPQEGKLVTLDNTPVYRTSKDTKPFVIYSGNCFRYYDNSIINGMARITTSEDLSKKNPLMIFGYIKIK